MAQARAQQLPLDAAGTRAWLEVIKWCARVQERRDAEREGRPRRAGWYDLPTLED
jgi:hypothetical protein